MVEPCGIGSFPKRARTPLGEEILSSTLGRLALGSVVSVVHVGYCGADGCNNDNFANRGVITAGPRFQLVIEEGSTPSRLLLDSTTGDLWQLRNTAAGEPQWVRVTRGPADARVLTPQEALGMRSPATSTP